MSQAALQPGKPRMGTVWFDRRDAGRPAMVFDSGTELEVTVNFEHDDPIGRRLIGRTVNWGDDPDYTLFDYSLPQQAWFADSHGIVCFVEPHGRTTSLDTSGEGRIRFRYAIEVGDWGVNYTSIHALTSRIEGLEEWIPISCVSHETKVDEDSSVSEVFTLRRQEPVVFSRRLNARIRPTYSFTSSPVPGQTLLNDRVLVETDARRARPWEEHLELHRCVRDLLVVAGWRDYGLWDLRVQRRDDPQRALAGNVLGNRWAPVSTYAVSQPSGNEQRNRYFFDFEDVGSQGLRRWSRLRGGYRRGIAGMIHSAGVQGLALETAISEVGAALEHIGYGIAIERGERPGRHLATHLRRIAAQTSVDLRFDVGTWPAGFADAYNTVKHPDRPDQWSALDLANVLREARLLFRAWVARRVGVSSEALQRNLAFIPMSKPYQAW